MSGFQKFHHPEPFKLRYNGGVLPQLDLAYETWGELNEAKDNAVLVFTGLSGSSHAKSHAVSVNKNNDKICVSVGQTCLGAKVLYQRM